MKKYKPKTPWIARGNLVYNLRHDGWRGGAPLMCNDVAVSIEARHLPKEVQREFGDLI